jgi:predicted nucleic acid-binding protein
MSTHPRVFGRPWSATAGWRFIDTLVASPGIELLLPTERHQAILGHTVAELPDARGNLMHDLHTAVLMREHGVHQIYTRDADFHRFRFLKVLDPAR